MFIFNLKALIRGLSLIAVLVSLAFIAACSQPDFEQEIRDKIEQTRTAIESRDNSDAIEYVSRDFLGNDQYDRSMVRRMLVAQFLANPNIGVKILSLDVTKHPSQGDRALMSASVLATGSSGWIPETGRALNLEGEWQQVDGDWKLKLLHWK